MNQRNLLALCLIPTGLLLSGASAFASSYAQEPNLVTKRERHPPAVNPFRLEIERSQYRVVAAQEMVESRKGRQPLNVMIDRHATARGLDPALVHAVVKAESAYRPDAVSPKGAVGLMQVMPATGKRFGETALATPEANLRAGTGYLRYLLDRFDDVPLALAAYNAGEGAVAKYGNKIPPYSETQDYVRAILSDYRQTVIPEAHRPKVYLDGIRLDASSFTQYRLKPTAF